MKKVSAKQEKNESKPVAHMPRPITREDIERICEKIPAEKLACPPTIEEILELFPELNPKNSANKKKSKSAKIIQFDEYSENHSEDFLSLIVDNQIL